MPPGSQSLAERITDLVINPFIALLFAIGLLVFIFGIVEYIWGLSNETEGREKGKQHMLWGIIGMFVMVAAWSIFMLIVRSLGAEDIFL